MSQTYTPPSTIAGISRLAKKISRDRGIKLKPAQDAAAKIAGFQNFMHAKHQLASVALQPLYLTAYWQDRTDRHAFGRCTAVVLLPVETLNVLPALKARGFWMLGGFELESADHLQARLDTDSLARAQKLITDAVRDLQFCASTGLRPMRKMADKRRVAFLQDLPGKDHMSLWLDGATGSWLALDEPYHPRSSEKATPRGDFLADHGLASVMPNWGGLYIPGNSIPHLVSADPALVQRVTEVVEKMAAVPVIDWDTHSGSYDSYFYSPHRVSSGKPYRPRPQRSYGERAGALPYGGHPGVASDWRPATSISLNQHKELGHLLRGLAMSRLPGPVYDKLTTLISTLDDWANQEHADESSSTLDALYYGGDRANLATVEEQLQGVAAARALVISGYQDCRPRRDVLKALDMVERAARKRGEQRAAVA
ncbi:DUF5623 domain-containing protein [Pseudomonas sp. V1]|uniref:DUF5623 domain-containing protein n=1 Tax=Pseudomonas arcuscaelestis TaxID=2710591 RepID=UPI00193F3660|nr:DUF5623 domain-containing protein [Pseudomonas arcuscaelestis]MBM3105892.1 DUF5623 domain-containing protein [Pseudomonas arcuscaelestis]